MVFFLYLTVSGIIWQILESIGQFKHAYINYYWTEEQTKNIEKSHLYQFRVWLDVRPFSISGRIPDIESIRVPDIWLIYNAGYPVIQLISNDKYPVIRLYIWWFAVYPVICRISGIVRISDIRNQLDIRYPAKKVSCPTLYQTDHSKEC